MFEPLRRLVGSSLGICLTLVTLLGLFVAGCGEARTAASGTSPSLTARSTAGETPSTDLTQVFSWLAATLAPMPVYGVPEVPEGAVVAADWWPVTQIDNPSGYSGASRANPHTAGLGSTEPQGELLLNVGTGWLDVVENFRGDLGETATTEVGNVGGHVAILCHANGGTLVQWSDGGRWYGVFGRGVTDEIVIGTALAARLVEPKKAE